MALKTLNSSHFHRQVNLRTHDVLADATLSVLASQVFRCLKDREQNTLTMSIQPGKPGKKINTNTTLLKFCRSGFSSHMGSATTTQFKAVF